MTSSTFSLFKNELGASYLPCFLRTYFQTPFVLTEEDEDTLIFWIDMTIWAGNLILVSACPRFVRDHPDEARSFYLILTERAANLPQWVYNVIYLPLFSFSSSELTRASLLWIRRRTTTCFLVASSLTSSPSSASSPKSSPSIFPNQVSLLSASRLAKVSRRWQSGF